MKISDEQALQLAHQHIHAHPAKNSTELIAEISANLMQNHQMPKANAHTVAINAVAEFCKPPGMSINTLKTNSTCVWLACNGHEYAVPLDELMALISAQTELSACA